MILDTLFTLLYFSLPAAALLLMRAAGMPLSRLSLPSFVILACFAFAYVGLLPLYFGWDEYRAMSGVNDRELLFLVFLGSTWTIFSLVLGAFLGRTLLGALRPPRPGFPLTQGEQFRIVLLLAGVALVLAEYLTRVPRIALLVALTGSITEAEEMRSLMGNDFGWGYHWYSLGMHDIANLLTFTTFSAWLLRKSAANFALFLCAFGLSAFAAVMAIEKGPLVWILIGLLLAWLLVRKGGTITMRSILPFMMLALVVMALIYMAFEGSASLTDALMAVFSRAFAGSVEPAYHYLQFFPAHHDFLYGRSFPNPAGLFPWEPYRLTEEVMDWVYPNDAGIVRSAPTIFWAELYANFGAPAVVIVPPFVGFALYLLALYVSRLPDSPVKTGYLVWLLLHFKNLATSSFSSFIIDIYFVGVTLVLLLALPPRTRSSRCAADEQKS
ncbi:hypothetical protein [Herbaspirillum seropedicae]|uniref:hypothetical protein n=1 Tax=Herbaspirillum seropedicae TaxID=964 RepID=UPI003FCCCDD4